MASYRLNLNRQANGDYEVQKAGCRYYLEQNYDYFVVFSSCAPAVAEAKRKHPYKRINGCVHYSKPCHTS